MTKVLVKRCARRSSNSLSHKRKTHVIGTERMAPQWSLHAVRCPEVMVIELIDGGTSAAVFWPI